MSFVSSRTRSKSDQDEVHVRRHRPDYWIVVAAIFLVVIGLTVVYAISPALSVTTGTPGSHYVLRQLLAIALSAVAFTVAAKVPIHTWRRLQRPLLVAAAVGTLLALITPVIPQYPAHRWIRLGGLSFQSVEAVKFALLIWLASFFAVRMREGTLGNRKLTLQPLVVLIVIVGVAIAGIQSDFGSTVVIMAMMAAMAFLVGMPMKRLVMIGGVLIIGAVLAISATPYRRERLLTFLHPASNCLTTGYQACQALISVGSGGISGLGLGQNVQAYGYLPEAQDDSIFAIYAEKFGFIGAVVMLGLFITLFARLRLIIERTQDTFSRLVVMGILAWLSVQMVINVGAMIGLLPLKGITLPLVSYGGTSVLSVGAALGLVFQISRYTSFSSRNIERRSTRTSGHPQTLSLFPDRTSDTRRHELPNRSPVRGRGASAVRRTTYAADNMEEDVT